MPALKKAFEAAGFEDVRTVLSSGNVVFSATPAPETALERRAETAMRSHLGRSFATIIRPLEALRMMIESDPYTRFDVAPEAKRVVTFLRVKPRQRPPLPIELDGARILGIEDRAVFTAYVRSPRGPVFMTLIEKTFGKDVTTRTWDTIKKVAT
jgi:uncharacterized protein (DUF1697 family)